MELSADKKDKIVRGGEQCIDEELVCSSSRTPGSDHQQSFDTVHSYDEPPTLHVTLSMNSLLSKDTKIRPTCARVPPKPMSKEFFKKLRIEN